MERINRYLNKKKVILKEKYDKSLINIIDGLLNSKGGVVILGINPESKEVIGINDLNIIKTINEIINNDLEPSPKEFININILSENEKIVIKLEINNDLDTLYAIKKHGFVPKGCYMYKDETLKNMSMKMISSRMESKENTYEQILKLIKQYPEYSSMKIGEMIDMSMRNTQRYIKGLKEEGVIERVGSNKTGRWEVKDKK